jgi:mannose-1-phosphate guanylyltransferase/mannose-6-phosphate isomerase
MVVFGITPTEPHTGYGYIRKALDVDQAGTGVYRVAAFKEKPDAATAAAYRASGDYLWNSGIFLVRADVYLRDLRQHAPDIANAAAAALVGAEQDGACLRLERRAFTTCPSDSIDYAVMEHIQNAMLVEMDAGWNDLGSWPSLLEAGVDGSGKNLTRGDVLLNDVRGSLIHSSSRLVTAIGLRDQVVVETPDAVFVAPMSRSQEVKDLVTALRDGRRMEAEHAPRVQRAWGWYECLAAGDGLQVRRVHVKPGAALPMQLHQRRSEHWVVVRGEAEVTLGERVQILLQGQAVSVPMNTEHRMRNHGLEILEVIEVQSGSYIGEDDVIHYEEN